MQSTTSQKNRLRIPILALLFCAIGFIIGYGFYHMSQNKYVVLNENHPGAVSLMNTFYWMESNLDASNERLKIDNERLSQAIPILAEKDPFNFKIYTDMSAKVTSKSDSAINDLLDVMKLILNDYNGSQSFKGKNIFNDPFILSKNLNDYYFNLHGNSIENKQRIISQEFLECIPSYDRTRFDFNGIAIGKGIKKLIEIHKNDTLQNYLPFENILIQAVPVIFSLLENEIRLTVNNILTFFLSRMGPSGDYFDIHKVTSYPKNQQIYKGETYTTDIYLLPNRPLYENMTILVDGNEIPFKNGPGKFSKKASNAGTYSYKVEIVLQSPRTLEKSNYSDIFEYTVIQREPTLQMQRPEVLYTGVDNLISIEVPDAPDFEFQLKGHSAGIDIASAGEDHPTQYVVSVSEPGPTSITVSGKYLKTTTFDFFAKKVPMPQISLAGKTGGEIAIEDFKDIGGISMEAIGFPLDIDMAIKQFELVRISKGEMVERITNEGAEFMDEAHQLLQKAESGDWYVIRNIQLDAYWDGEETGYRDMVFNVK